MVAGVLPVLCGRDQGGIQQLCRMQEDFLRSHGLVIRNTFVDALSPQESMSPSRSRGKSAPPQSPKASSTEGRPRPRNPGCPAASDQAPRCGGADSAVLSWRRASASQISSTKSWGGEVEVVVEAHPEMAGHASHPAGLLGLSMARTTGQDQQPYRKRTRRGGKGYRGSVRAAQAEAAVLGSGAPWASACQLSKRTTHPTRGWSSSDAHLGDRRCGWRVQQASFGYAEDVRSEPAGSNSCIDPATKDVMLSLEGCWHDSGKQVYEVRVESGDDKVGSWSVYQKGRSNRAHALVWCPERKRVYLDRSYELDLKSQSVTDRAVWHAVTTDPASGGGHSTFVWERVTCCHGPPCKRGGAPELAPPPQAFRGLKLAHQ